MKTVMNHSHDGWLLKMISRTDPVINRRYNLSGRPTNGEKGINIIRMSDGTTKKVLVK